MAVWDKALEGLPVCIYTDETLLKIMNRCALKKIITVPPPILDHAPVNTLASTLVASFNENFEKATNDAKVKAILVTGKGKFFCGGAAVDEMGKDPSGGIWVRQGVSSGCPFRSHLCMAGGVD